MNPRLDSAIKPGNGPKFDFKSNLTVRLRNNQPERTTMSFKQAANNFINEAPARTANGMLARKTTASAVLDFFGKAGSSRGTPLKTEFMAALAEDESLAIRALLWTRDIREGAGERKQFRDMLQALEEINPALAGKFMHKIPVLGRWDDIFSYQNPINRKEAFDMIGAALNAGDGLCAKWMHRKGKLAAELRSHLGMTPKQYRKTLVNLTNVVETAMCAKEWDEINFSHVPSLASARYQKAFGRNASEKYSAYIAELQKPQSERKAGVKINAGAVYPYDVVKSVSKGNAAAADAQWDALPNFVGSASIFPIVDTSGSMGYLPGIRGSYGWYSASTTVQPIDVAVSLGLYLSEKNRSDFKDLLMVFNTTPEMVRVRGTISQRIACLPERVAGSTNLHAAFDMLLQVAVRGRVAQEDMPEVLLILSDMQFNCCRNYDDTAIQMIRRKYETAGYKMPAVVFWNLSPYGRDNTPVRFDENGTALVSGFSPAIMKSVLGSELENFTPYNVMLKTLMSDRYAY